MNEKKGDVRFKLILHNSKSISQAQIWGGTYKFANIPKGESATIFSIKIIDDKPYLSTQEIVISENVENQLKYELLTDESLKRYTEKLNSFYN